MLDTSVLVAALRSDRGASYALVSSIPSPRFQIVLSIALYTEWRDVLSRPEHILPGRAVEDVHGFLRYLASQAHLQEIHFLWRPCLPDPDDDMVLELAFAAGCSYIVTHNVIDFEGSRQLGVLALSPAAFLQTIRSPS